MGELVEADEDEAVDEDEDEGIVIGGDIWRLILILDKSAIYGLNALGVSFWKNKVISWHETTNTRAVFESQTRKISEAKSKEVK